MFLFKPCPLLLVVSVMCPYYKQTHNFVHVKQIHTVYHKNECILKGFTISATYNTYYPQTIHSDTEKLHRKYHYPENMIACIITRHTVNPGSKIVFNIIEFQFQNYIFIYKWIILFWIFALLSLSIYFSAHKVPTESYLSQLSWKDSPLYTEMQPEKRQSQPEPPSPAPGQQPLQIRDLWEQYLEPTTERCYYVNSITKERSWKPPRRAHGRTASTVTHPTLLLLLLNEHLLILLKFQS